MVAAPGQEEEGRHGWHEQVGDGSLGINEINGVLCGRSARRMKTKSSGRRGANRILPNSLKGTLLSTTEGPGSGVSPSSVSSTDQTTPRAHPEKAENQTVVTAAPGAKTNPSNASRSNGAGDGNRLKKWEALLDLNRQFA